ncbi:MAG: DUF3226 domain-containing protein [Candidatus Methylumidiphilus sp.]
MAHQEKKLLVEGETDRSFFQACLREAGIIDEVGVCPPTDYKALGSGKGNALHILPMLITNLADGTLSRLALIVDADFTETYSGFSETWRKITGILRESGYCIPENPPTSTNGFIFTHTDGLPDFGLWIMPNNTKDGMLEDFIKASIVCTEKPLLAHALTTVNSLPNRKFKDIHLSKAEIATWMAWQTIPGQSIAGAVGGKLLDFQTGQAKQFLDWLKKVYT